MNPRDLILAAYDPDLVRECGCLLAETISGHLRAVQNGEGPVQDWATPQANIQIADRIMSGSATDDSNELARRFERLVQLSLSRGQNLHHPHYIGHQVPASLPLVGLFDAVTMLTNQVQGVYEMGPWAVAVECAVLQRIGEAIGLEPGEFGGLITSGGSLANLTALLAARNIACGDSWRGGLAVREQPPVLIVQADAHYCVDRAAGVMGLGTEQVIRVPLDDRRQMKVSGLDQILTDLGRRGVPVVAVVAVACTTATGAFDPIDEIADVCAKHHVWLHVDAAHGGSVALSNKHRHLVRGLQRADSVVVDAHKMMFLPAVCAMVFYRQSDHRLAAFQQSAPYLFDPSAPQIADYDNASFTFECTKRAAAVGLWGVWSMFGKSLFEAMVDTVIETAMQLHRLIVDHESFEPTCVPTCNIVVFRYLPPWLRDAPPEEVDAVQLELRRSVLESGQAYLTQTRLDGRIHLRSTIMNPLTDQSHLKNILESLCEHGRQLTSSSKFGTGQ